jgi:hypothetical protein
MIRKLHDAGQPRAAMMLEEFQRTAYTTSSEWWGKLGLTIRRMEREFRLDDELRRDLLQIMAAVQEVWPKL